MSYGRIAAILEGEAMTEAGILARYPRAGQAAA